MEVTPTHSRSLPAWLYFGVLLFVASALVLHDNSADRDLWHRLALGQYAFEHHALPAHDVFSYLSEPRPLHDHEWGSGVLFYALYKSFDGAALVALKLAAYLGLLLLIDRTARFYRKDLDLPALLWMLLIALALAPAYISTVRCLVFTNFFLALWLYWLVRLRAGYHQPAWPFFITAIFWANLHGGFPAGLGLIAVYAFGEKLNHRPWRPFVRIGIVAALGTLINPYGYHLWTSTFHAVNAPRLHIYEWAATPLGDFSYLGFKLLAVASVLITLLILVTGRARGNWDWVAVLAVGVTLILALRHLRHLTLFSIVGGVLAYRGLNLLRGEPASSSGRGQFRLAALILPLFVIVAAFLLQHGDRFTLRIAEPDYPVRAMEFLKTYSPENAPVRKSTPTILVPFNWGSYALWQLYPNYLVSLDGRYELVYSQETYRAVTDFFLHAPNWDNVLRQHAPDAILLPRRTELEADLIQRHHYRIIYQDALAAVLVR